VKFRNEATVTANTRGASVLDLPVRLTSPLGWIAIVALVVALVIGAVWAVVARLPQHIGANGIIGAGGGFTVMESEFAGQVVKLKAEEGSTVEAGEELIRISSGGRKRVVRAPARMRVESLRVKVGEVVQIGDTLAITSNGADDTPLVAVVYVDARAASSIAVGTPADLNVDSAPVLSYGLLRGEVASVAEAAEEPAELVRSLGNEDAARAATAAGAVRRVVIRLRTAPGTATGYEWSRAQGPPFELAAATNVVASIQQSPVRPIDWILG
jgi:multidrug efflux pump subunit AcrA (membrane-fusion protein)